MLESQNADGSWYYAVDGVRDFVDHFHTCFVMKALAKIHTLTGHAADARGARRAASSYYLDNLFDDDGLPEAVCQGAAPDRLQARAVRLRRVHQPVPAAARPLSRSCDATLETVVAGDPAGLGQARRLVPLAQLLLGWDNVPMHRWAQSQMFRSLAFYYRESWPATAPTSPVLRQHDH